MPKSKCLDVLSPAEEFPIESPVVSPEDSHKELLATISLSEIQEETPPAISAPTAMLPVSPAPMSLVELPVHKLEIPVDCPGDSCEESPIVDSEIPELRCQTRNEHKV